MYNSLEGFVDFSQFDLYKSALLSDIPGTFLAIKHAVLEAVRLVKALVYSLCRH
jgi:hypothetical protein